MIAAEITPNSRLVFARVGEARRHYSASEIKGVAAKQSHSAKPPVQLPIWQTVLVSAPGKVHEKPLPVREGLEGNQAV
jgi:hypothetical protein